MTDIERTRLEIEKQRQLFEARKLTPPSMAIAPRHVPEQPRPVDVSNDLNREMPLDLRIRITYAPLLCKSACIKVAQLIYNMLVESKVTDTKSIYRQFKEILDAWDDRWTEDYNSNKEQQEQLDTLTERWIGPYGTSQPLSKLRLTYNLELRQAMPKLEPNTADLVAWIHALLDLSNIGIHLDDENLKVVQQYTRHKISRAPNDIAYAIRKNLQMLLDNFYEGRTPVASANIDTMKKHLDNHIRTFDYLNMVDDWMAQQDTQEESGTPCSTERCSWCDSYPCKIRKKRLKAAIKP